MDASRKRGVALVGLAAWACFVGGIQPAPPEAFLLLAALSIVPLGGQLAAGESPRRPLRLALLGQPGAAVLMAASLAQNSGLQAATLVIPWLLVTLLVGLEGARRLRDGPWTLPEMVEATGLAYLAIGGVWTVATRLGLRPLGFPNVIVVMTAVHFHYAGFVLLLLASRVVREYRGPLGVTAALGSVAGVPLVAIGITESQLGLGLTTPRLLEVTAAVVMASSAILVGFLQAGLAVRGSMPMIPRFLLFASGLSVLVPMCLAVAYAGGAFMSRVWVDILQMFQFHGAFNALGFSLLGLLGWSLLGNVDSAPDQSTEIIP